MKADDYQNEALRTANLHQYSLETRLANWALGLSGESGEVSDEIKKIVFHKHSLDRQKLAKELGDVQWYIATCAKDLGFNLSEIMELNVEKLRARYPDGFSPEKSKNRDGVEL